LMLFWISAFGLFRLFVCLFVCFPPPCRTSKVSPYLVRAGAYMYKTSARAQVFVAGRWVPTVQAMADGYIDEAYRRCPLMHYNKKTKRWAATSRPPIRNWVVMRKGGWWFLSKRMLSKYVGEKGEKKNCFFLFCFFCFFCFFEKHHTLPTTMLLCFLHIPGLLFYHIYYCI
jgi:hypothetical protein